MQENNTCYTYFSIKGDFEPDEITARLGLQPYKTRRIGDERPSLSFPKTKYTFSSWDFGRCENYDREVTNQMSETIRPLLDRVDLLNQIREDYDVTFGLVVVPNIYGGNRESSPCLAPSLEVMAFCVATQTVLDIDLYVFCEEDERLDREEIKKEDEQRAKAITQRSLGDNIREYRLKSGMTQNALAAALYVTPQAISKWETGQTAPDVHMLLSLGEVLQISVDQMLGGDRRQSFERRYREAALFGHAAALLVCEDALKEFPFDEAIRARRANAEFFFAKECAHMPDVRRTYLHRASYHMLHLHEQYPNNDGYITFLAQIYAELGKPERARAVLTKCKNREVADRILCNHVLEGDEKIRLQQTRLGKPLTELYNQLLEYDTPESIAAAGGLLEVTMGEEVCRKAPYLRLLYLAQAALCLRDNDMAGYEAHMLEAYEAALSYDRDIADAEHTAAPLFDHLIDEYAEWSPSEMNELISHVLSDHKLTPPCEAKRRMVEQHIECRPLLPHDAQAYYRFCVSRADRGWAYWNFSNVWNMSAQEQDELNQTFLTDNARLYPGNAYPYHMELHREQLVRLINEHVMSGYVATHKHAGRAQILGYCNCGAKETYQGLPSIWREVAEPAEKRVFALAELLVAKPFLACGLEEKLLTHAMEKAREQGFTHAQVFLCEEGLVDGDGNNCFERFLALYTAMGFTLHADRSDAYWRINILEKAL